MFNPNNLHSLVAAFEGGLSVFLYNQDNARDLPASAGYWTHAADFGAKVGDFVIIRPAVGNAAEIYRFTAVNGDGTAEFVQAIRIDMINAVAPALAVLAASGIGEEVAWDDITGKPEFGTAAEADVEDFATAAQGELADTAYQAPGTLPAFDDTPEGIAAALVTLGLMQAQ